MHELSDFIWSTRTSANGHFRGVNSVCVGDCECDGGIVGGTAPSLPYMTKLNVIGLMF
jgi:hypothetical protein